MKNILLPLMIGLLLNGWPGMRADAQILYGQQGNVSTGIIVQRWEITPKNGGSTTTLTQEAMPVTLFIPLRENLEMTMVTSAAVNEYEIAATIPAAKLSGLTNSRFQAAYAMRNDTVLLTGGIALPTGKRELSEDEAGVSAQLADDVLSLPVKRLGEGLDVNVGLTVAQKAGPLVFGLGGGYVIRGGYSPLAELAQTYKPGNELRMSGGLDLARGQQFRLRLDGVYTVYAADTQGEDEVFRNGNRLDVRAVAGYQTQQFVAQADIRGIFRAKNSYLGHSEPYDGNGNDLRMTGQVRYALSSALALRGSVTAKQLAANAYPANDPRYEGEGSVTSVGGGLDVTLKKRLTIGVGGRGFSGSLQNGDDVSGFEGSLTISAGL